MVKYNSILDSKCPDWIGNCEGCPFCSSLLCVFAYDHSENEYYSFREIIELVKQDIKEVEDLFNE